MSVKPALLECTHCPTRLVSTTVNFVGWHYCQGCARHTARALPIKLDAEQLRRFLFPRLETSTIDSFLSRRCGSYCMDDVTDRWNTAEKLETFLLEEVLDDES